MTANSFGKFLIPAALSTGAVFSALMTPLWMFSDQSLTISNGEGQITDLALKDVSAPYTGVVGLISLGLGASSLAAAGLRSAARQSAQADQTLLARQQQLEARESYLQQALTSEHFLDRSGLSFFLEDEVSLDSEPVLHPSLMPATLLTSVPLSATVPVSASVAAPVSAPVAAAAVATPVNVRQWVPTTVAEPVVAQPTMAQPAIVKSVVAPGARLEMAQAVMGFVQPTSASRAVQPAAPTFAVTVAAPAEPAWVPSSRPAMQSMVDSWPSAQGFLSFARPGMAQGESGWNAPMTAQDQASIAQIHALQFQLQQIVSQIESLQTDLQPEPALQIFETVSYPEAPLPVPARPHRSEWIVQRVAS